jgi:hypothetical protein
MKPNPFRGWVVHIFTSGAKMKVDLDSEEIDIILYCIVNTTPQLEELLSIDIDGKYVDAIFEERKKEVTQWLSRIPAINKKLYNGLVSVD